MAVLVADTFDGKIHIEWDPQVLVTPLGQLPFFIQYLKVGHLFEPWVDDCPLSYAYLTSLKGDTVNARLLSMTKVISDDNAQRALHKIDEADGIRWLQEHLYRCYSPLLSQPWILDTEVTVKPLYGNLKGAIIGYNTKNPGRPSHTYHTYMIANLRLILDVEVQASNQSTSCYSAPGLNDDDRLVYVNNVINGKLLESQILVQQAANNTKEQFANSPDLSNDLMNAIIDAFAAHTTMSKQTLDSERVRSGLRDILLGPAQLYEALRARGESWMA